MMAIDNIVSRVPKAWLARPVAVLGNGVSGKAVSKYLDECGIAISVYDERAGGGRGRRFDRLTAKAHRLVVYSPGFSPQHPWLVEARNAGCSCLGELDFASLLWNGRVLAVTGTNGKSTLCSLLAKGLNRAGLEAAAVGNIGTPFTTLAGKGDQKMWAVVEVSSFQAETLNRFQADSLIWTNFTEDHLDRHGSNEEYFRAKWNLVSRLRGASIVTGFSVFEAAQRFGLQWPESARVACSVEALGLAPELLMRVPFPQRENISLAMTYWKMQGLPESTLLETLDSFRVDRHRLGRSISVGGVRFWNDSKATNTSAVRAALSQFQDKIVLIGGGRAKGGDTPCLADAIAGRICAACLIGESAPELAPLLAARGVSAFICASMMDAVRKGYEMARPEGDVLLSPGFASQDMFRDYAERGEVFERGVFQLKEGNLQL